MTVFNASASNSNRTNGSSEPTTSRPHRIVAA